MQARGVLGVVSRVVEILFVQSLRRIGAGALLVIAVAACNASNSERTPPQGDDGPPSEVVGGAPRAIATLLRIPWSIVRVGDEALVSERNTARILAFRPGEALRVIGTVPGVTARADGGLLGLALRELDGTQWIYAFHSTMTDNRIVRMRYAADALSTPEVVLQGIPGGRGHNGGRIGFGPDGMLYAVTGDAQMGSNAQDTASLGGKVLRMTPDGDVPTDNPTPGSLVYSMGHRNPEGLAWDAAGRLWITEFGEDGWDELNRIEPGANYGWPIVEGNSNDPSFVNPVVQWRTAEMGPSGLAFVDDTFFIAGLTGRRLWTVVFDAAGEPITAAHFAGEFGRIRDVVVGPDDDVWFMSNRTDGRGDAPGPDDDRIFSVSRSTL